MARLSSFGVSRRRSGVVLLIVMAMLALFATVGLSFVFYAESESNSARVRRQIEVRDLSDIHPEALFNFALGQLIFDTDDTTSGIYGHSLARSIYGTKYGTVPFNGLGRPIDDTATPMADLTKSTKYSPDDYPPNVPYTFPDINNPFLASMDADGTIRKRSFARNKTTLSPFNAPGDDTDEGEVRNVDSSKGVANNKLNDAFWVDCNFPVMTAKDGTRYKPLFAFTVIDLDNRINLSVAGNPLANYAAAGSTTSRLGLGPWEINPAKVLPDASEIDKLFAGRSTATVTVSGRYGTNGPDHAMTFATTPTYSRVDYTGKSTDNIVRPNASFTQFPTFGGWNDAAVGSPAGFDFFASRKNLTAGSDRHFAPSNAEAILRIGERGSATLTSDLLRLLPQSLKPLDALNPTNTTARSVLNLVTPYSMSLDTAHLAPLFVGAGDYTRPDGEEFPKAASLAINTNANPTGDFYPKNIAANPDLRSILAAELRRINLNRGLNSMADRQNLAQDIFDRLVAVTGAKKPTGNPPFTGAVDTKDPHYRATRWLAQYAVNLVDFLDTDDTMTVFHWNPYAFTEDDYVFGVEMNRLLINEAYASFDNDKKADPGVEDALKPDGKKFRVNVWAELFNPLSNSVPRDGGQAVLADLNGPKYRIAIAESPNGIKDHPTGNPEKLLSDDYVKDWPNGHAATPGDGKFKTDGFYLVGPPTDTFLAKRKPDWTSVTWNHESANMSTKLQDLPQAADWQDEKDKYDKLTIVLQRLADPTKVEDSDASDPTKYNPFVTVDYFTIKPQDSVLYIGEDEQKTIGELTEFASRGRFQPHQASNVKDQDPDPAEDKEIKHTFGRQNSKKDDGTIAATGDTLKEKFDAVIHLDRLLTSAAEAALAPIGSPAEYTHRFPNVSAVNAFQNKDTLLIRFLETVTTGSLAYNEQLKTTLWNNYAGTGRHAVFAPGKININTVNDKRVLDALFDPATNSFFKDADVQGFWDDLQANDVRPIAGFADYRYTAGKITARDTLLRTNGGNNLFAKMFTNSNGQLDFEKSEAFRKAMNNITFTSNVFAVWVTVGFFPYNDSTNKVEQPEIGRDEGRHVRHRMFAIVDRSQIVMPEISFGTVAADAARGTTTVSLSAAMASVTQPKSPAKVEMTSSLPLAKGMVLTLDRDVPDKEESVVVLDIAGNTITVSGLRKAHKTGATVHLGIVGGKQVPLNATNPTPAYTLGYPGPQPAFTLREYGYVVPHWNIID